MPCLVCLRRGELGDWCGKIVVYSGIGFYWVGVCYVAE